MKHGMQEIIGDFTVTHLDPIMSLGPRTKVTEMYRARRHGASPQDDCLVFLENQKLACYRHLTCQAIPAIDEIRARAVSERRAAAVGS